MRDSKMMIRAVDRGAALRPSAHPRSAMKPAGWPVFFCRIRDAGRDIAPFAGFYQGIADYDAIAPASATPVAKPSPKTQDAVGTKGEFG